MPSETSQDLTSVFEEHEPDPDRIVTGTALQLVARRARERRTAEAQVVEAVDAARAEGHSWAAIGAVLGRTGEAARLRYGVKR